MYLVSRALVRTVLSKYSLIEPHAWEFKKNFYGRPEILPTIAAPPLRFNLSHTGGLAACAIVLDRDVGIDVEDVTRQTQTVEIADRYFSPAEVGALRSLPHEAQRHRFFAYWTLKESYIKARGMGLSIPLEHFTFHIEGDSSIRISFAPELPDDPSTWQFGHFQPSTRHMMSVCVRRRNEPDLKIELRETVPLVS
jgi:4'-phosphopantetheinyl transferase